MAAIAKTSATTSTVLTGVRSWADVARGVASSPRDVDHDEALELKQPQKAQSNRPWRMESAAQPVSFEKPSTSSGKARPWTSLAERMASAFADYTDDEEPEAAEPPQSEDELQGVLKPAARGSRQCVCHGEVLIMLGNYGWLAPHDTIDHPAVAKNGGRIYVHRRDVAGGLTLVEGDWVTFYLYVDDQGLGAEDCRLQNWATEERTTCVSTKSSAAMNPHAATFVPCMNPDAASFVPSTLQSAFCPPTPAYVAPKLNFLAVNEAYWSDDSDEESDSADSDGGSDGDDEIDARVNKRRGIVNSRSRRAARKTNAKTSSRGSASTGVSSDSEGLLQHGPPPGLAHPTIRPPPGLSLP